MSFGRRIGRRDDYITATGPLGTGADAYDDDGKLVRSGTAETFGFFGDVRDIKSDVSIGNGKRRDVKTIEITADSRDVEGLTPDFTLVISGGTDKYQVVDVYEANFRYTSVVLAQYTR